MYFYENAQKELFFFSFQTLAISHNIQAECLKFIISHIAPALPAGTLYILEYLHYMHKIYSTDYRHYPAIHKKVGHLLQTSPVASEYAWTFLKDTRKHDLPAIGNLRTLEQIRERRKNMKNGYGLLHGNLPKIINP